jgi:hypothetical protein
MRNERVNRRLQCEHVQSTDHGNCRRCGEALAVPVVNVVERVVEGVVLRQDAQCLENLQEAPRVAPASQERQPGPPDEQDDVPIVRSPFPLDRDAASK